MASREQNAALRETNERRLAAAMQALSERFGVEAPVIDVLPRFREEFAIAQLGQVASVLEMVIDKTAPAAKPDPKSAKKPAAKE